MYEFEPINPEEGKSELILATAGTVTSSGITLIFDGEDVATSKKYKRLKTGTLSAGQRLLVLKQSGTYIVLGAIASS